MVVLGVNVAGAEAFLAFSDDGMIMDVAPYSCGLSSSMGTGEALVQFQSTIRRHLEDLDVARVVILDPAAGYSATHKQFGPRIAVEAAILMAAATAGIPGAQISQAKVRSVHGFPRSGALQSHADTVVTSVGKYWAGKRSLAALAALAVK